MKAVNAGVDMEMGEAITYNETPERTD